eukprot:6201508-Pleurochrysis_carterae.AAC.1
MHEVSLRFRHCHRLSGGCTKCRLGSGTATSFLRWLLKARALRLLRRWGARGRCRPPLLGCAEAA